MICRLYHKQLSLYLDGELPATRARRLEAHLRVCQQCQSELHAIMGISHHIREASEQIQVSRDFDQRVLRAVGYWQVTGRQTVRSRSYLRPLLTLMLALLALLGLVRWFFWEPLPGPAPQRQPALAGAGPAAPAIPVAPAERGRR